MAYLWYLERRGNQLRPYPEAKLKELAVSGRLLRDDLPRGEDQTTPVAAAKVESLFPVASAIETPKGHDEPPPLPKFATREETDRNAPGNPTDAPESGTSDPRFAPIGAHARNLGETTKAAARLAAAQARN